MIQDGLIDIDQIYNKIADIQSAIENIGTDTENDLFKALKRLNEDLDYADQFCYLVKQEFVYVAEYNLLSKECTFVIAKKQITDKFNIDQIRAFISRLGGNYRMYDNFHFLNRQARDLLLDLSSE